MYWEPNLTNFNMLSLPRRKMLDVYSINDGYIYIRESNSKLKSKQIKVHAKDFKQFIKNLKAAYKYGQESLLNLDGGQTEPELRRELYINKLERKVDNAKRRFGISD